MRVRPHTSSAAPSLMRPILAALLIASTAVVALGTGTPTHAAECGGSSTIDAGGGSVGGWCAGTTPGPRPGSTTSSSQSTLWSSWGCEGYTGNTYEDGFRVTFTFNGTLDEERLTQLGFDLTGTYAQYLVHCVSGPGDGVGTWRDLVYWETSAPVPVETLRDNARARINPPSPSVASNPPFNQPGRFGVVNFPTWLWINDAWEPIGPESETSGFVTVEVSATPRNVTWVTGDGSEPVVCGGPGVPWSPGMPEEASDCTHTFTSSSADLPGQQYALSATVEWYFEWWINGIYQGEFESFDATSPFTYQVGEIQSVEVN